MTKHMHPQQYETMRHHLVEAVADDLDASRRAISIALDAIELERADTFLSDAIRVAGKHFAAALTNFEDLKRLEQGRAAR